MDDQWEFGVPLQKEDLLKKISSQYQVENVLDLQKSLKKTKALKSVVSSQGCISILEHFDTLYSVFCDSNISFLQLQEVYDLAISRYLSELKEFVQEALACDNPLSKRQALNVIKMILYLFSLFLRAYEDKLNQNAENFISESKAAKKKKKASNSAKPEELWDWIQYKMEAFQLVFVVLSMNVNCLWPSLVADEPFVNMLANCCYKSFENPDILQAKNKALKDAISQVLALLVSQYNHGLTFISRIVELVKKNENTVSAASNTAMIIAREHNCSSVLPRLLSEFHDILLEDDVTGVSKSVSSFITDIAEIHPELLFSPPCLGALTKNLVLEPYAVRNATLTAFCEILLKCLAGELNEADAVTRRKLLKYLHNHLRDQNAYVRSKDLQLWAKLAEAHAVPKDFVSELTKTAVHRINDKSAFVVKSAVQFFCTLLKNNPFAGKFEIKKLELELLEAKAILNEINSKRTLSREGTWKKAEAMVAMAITKELEKGDVEVGKEQPSAEGVSVQDVIIIIARLIQEGLFAEAYSCLRLSEARFPKAKELRCNMDDGDKAEYYTNVLKKIFMNGSSQLPQEFDCHTEEYQKQTKVVEYAEEATAFAKLMCTVCAEVEKVLKGKSLLEVLEAIEFFTMAYQFGFEAARPVIRDMLKYVRCKHPGVKEAVVAAYKTLYLDTAQPTPRGKALHISQRLIRLVKDLDYEQKTALAELMQEWITNKELRSDFVDVLWEKYCNEQYQEIDRVGALILLEMIAASNPDIISSNISVLVETGFSTSANNDNVIQVCNTLMKLRSLKKNGKHIRYYSTHPMFEKVAVVLAERFSKTRQKGFKRMALAVMQLVFSLSYHPEDVADKILFECYKCLFPPLDTSKASLNDSSRSTQGQSKEESVQETLLARLFCLYSEMVFRKWKYFDRDVTNSLTNPESKPQNQALENEAEEMDEFENQNRDAEDDEIATSMVNLCEKLVLNDSKVDCFIRDFIVDVCRGAKESTSVSLKAAAASSLAKLMMVSREFCEKYTQLCFTMMEKSAEEIVRSNLVFGIGDLLCRFPNIIEPWTSHIYARLKDSSVLVRKNTVLVLSHLITREMIKVRGQIAEVCLCLEDPEPTIAGAVESLLVDLSKKGNTLYNIIADIISRLSNPDRPDPVSREAFNRIMKFTLTLIGKERHNELLVEKVCVRLKEASTERQWQDLAFCLSQLTYNEKSLRRLCDALTTFNERLECREVYSVITGIINTANKAVNKPKLKEIAQECQTKLDEILSGKNKEETVKEVPIIAEESPENPEMDEVFETPAKRRIPRSNLDPQSAEPRSARATRTRKRR